MTFQEAVLAVVERHSTATSGWCTAEIAQFVGRQPGAVNARQHSAAVLRELRALEAAGRVRRLDDKLPIVWCKPA